MSLDLDEWGCGVRRPEGDCSILVTDMKNGVVGVLGEGGRWALSGWMFSNDLAGGCVSIAKEAAVFNAGEKKVVRQEREMSGLDVLVQTVNFDSGVVVDVGVFLLSHSKILIIV